MQSSKVTRQDILLSVLRSKQLLDRELALEQQPQEWDQKEKPDEYVGEIFGDNSMMNLLNSDEWRAEIPHSPQATVASEGSVEEVENARDFLMEFRKMLDENINNFYQCSEEMEWRFSLYVRFHSRFIHQTTKSKFSWEQVGQILKRPHKKLQETCLHEIARIRIEYGSEVVIDLLQEYQDHEFHNIEAPIDEKEVRKYLKMEDVNDGVHGMAIDSSVLQLQAGMSMAERAQEISQVVGQEINMDRLAVYYHMAGIKKKPVDLVKISVGKYALRREDEKINLKRGLIRTIKEDRMFVFVDETIFLAKDYQHSKAWAGPGENVKVQFPGSFSKNVTMICAISPRGVEHYQLLDGYVDTEYYCKFLKNLRDKLGGTEKISLFYDGLSVHKTRAARLRLRKYNWLRLLNVAYASSDNPIENVFAEVKRKYRLELLSEGSRQFSGLADKEAPKIKIQEIIHKVMTEISQPYVEKIIDYRIHQIDSNYQLGLKELISKMYHLRLENGRRLRKRQIE